MQYFSDEEILNTVLIFHTDRTLHQFSSLEPYVCVCVCVSMAHAKSLLSFIDRLQRSACDTPGWFTITVTFDLIALTLLWGKCWFLFAEENRSTDKVTCSSHRSVTSAWFPRLLTGYSALWKVSLREVEYGEKGGNPVFPLH